MTKNQVLDQFREKISSCVEEDQCLENLWSQFMVWMAGQTVSVDENGETDFYERDVSRFIFHWLNHNGS